MSATRTVLVYSPTAALRPTAHPPLPDTQLITAKSPLGLLHMASRYSPELVLLDKTRTKVFGSDLIELLEEFAPSSRVLLVNPDNDEGIIAELMKTSSAAA